MAQKHNASTGSTDLVGVGSVVDKRFLIVRKIKSGGFGQVYEAKDLAHQNAPVGLKVEDRSATPVLGHEVQVLSRMKGREHIVKMFGCGKIENRVNYIAISDLRRQCPQRQNARFSANTASRLCREWLEAIFDLHSIGYIHRDIKGSNSAIGCTARTQRVVYMIDYGMARLHVLPSGKVVPERPRVSCRGTVRYASIAAHRNRDLGRKDDLISLFYTISEAYLGRLPWRHLHDKNAVMKVKLQVKVEAVCKGAPKEIATMGTYLESLAYANKPDYTMLFRLIEDMNIRLGTKSSDPYDWEEGWKTYQAEIASSSPTYQKVGP